MVVVPVAILLTALAAQRRDIIVVTLQVLLILVAVNLAGAAIVTTIAYLRVAVSQTLGYALGNSESNCTSIAGLDYSKLVNLKRYKLGRLPYGEPIYECRTTGQIALTFDDGPYLYTKRLLDILKDSGAKATFFITGSNLAKGSIDDPALPWASLIRRMYREGHQIAAHTWTHPDLETLSESSRRREMYRLELAFSKILGKIPTYMRPPYSSCEDSCLATMKILGYHVIYFDLDTDDYNHILANQIQDSVKIATDIIRTVDPRTASIISIAHDIHPLSVLKLTVEMLKVIKAKGFQTVTVGECLGDARSYWYRSLIV
ncbi:hypothetical protein TWF281_008584 [Arthrobotrys megalospora]